jgi:hypothetical protein
MIDVFDDQYLTKVSSRMIITKAISDGCTLIAFVLFILGKEAVII